jgi:lambda repressor-like predicted transcriptional regulator
MRKGLLVISWWLRDMIPPGRAAWRAAIYELLTISNQQGMMAFVDNGPSNEPRTSWITMPGERTIERIIEETGITVAELAEKANIDKRRTQAIVDGRWTPSPKERERIAAALGLTIEQISWGHTMNFRNVTYHRKGMKENF